MLWVHPDCKIHGITWEFLGNAEATKSGALVTNYMWQLFTIYKAVNDANYG